MATGPSEKQLEEALSAAGTAHHNYESVYLGGTPDEHWAGWYAAYALGRLNDFTTPTILAGWLQEVSGDANWSKNAAAHVISKLGS